MAEKAADNSTAAADTGKASADLDVTKLLVEEDEAAPEETQVNAAPADADEGAGEAEDKAESDDAKKTEETQDDSAKDDKAQAKAEDDKAAPGTPDKALQQLQQDLATATRKIGDLQAKVDAGEKLTVKEKEQVQTAQRKLETVRASLMAKRAEGKEIDFLDHGLSDAVAESLIEADTSIAELRKELAATKAEVASLKPAVQQAQTAELWEGHSKAYPGVAVADVWTKALADAQELVGVDLEAAKSNPALAKALSNAASNLFHQRSAIAAKSVAGKQPAKDGKETKDSKTTTRQTPPVTPGGARVTASTGVVKTGQPSEDSEYMQRALSLVTED